MKTIIISLSMTLLCSYCHAQLKVENSIPKPKKEEVYDISQDLYIGDSHREKDYERYQIFVNQRIFCISNDAFKSGSCVVKRQIIKLIKPIVADVQYKKKKLPFVINEVATYLYRPKVQSIESQSSDMLLLDDMRGDDVHWLCCEKPKKEKPEKQSTNPMPLSRWANKEEKTYTMTLYNIRGKAIVENDVTYAGHSYLIKKILSPDEVLSFLEKDSRWIPEKKDKNGNIYYESSISGKTFLTQSIQNDILIKDDFSFGRPENWNNTGEDWACPIFLLEDEDGVLFLTQLNRQKYLGEQWNEKPYTAYIIENHITYLKEKYVGKLYRIQRYPDPDVISKIEDIVIRDNMLRVKYVNVETQSIGYRAMAWNPTGKQWVIPWAEEFIP